jgi:hypothetical protein
MSKKRRHICSRERAVELFGELDVVRAERRGIDYYVSSVASPKVHYLAFAAVLLQYQMRISEDQLESVQQWLGSLPELLRGALIWWLQCSHFLESVLKVQRHHGHWPFEDRYKNSAHLPHK